LGGTLTMAHSEYAEVRLLNGDVFTVEGTLDEVESKLLRCGSIGPIASRLVHGVRNRWLSR
jgi:hypothetical protein